MDEALLSENLCYYFWDRYNNQKNNFQDTEGISDQSPIAEYVLFVMSILICVIGLTGNVIVICVIGFIVKTHKCKIWFLNLAFANFVFLLCMPLDAISEFTGNWIFGLVLCKTYNFLYTCNKYSSVFIITALNIERVLSVAKPIWHLRVFSRRICFWICSVIWSVTVIFSFPLILYSSISSDDDGKNECRWYDFRSSLQNTSKEVYDMASGGYSTASESYNLNYEYEWLPHSREQCKDSSCCYSAEMNEWWIYLIFLAKSVIIPLILFGCFIPLCIIVFSNLTIAIIISKSQTVKPPRLYKIVITVVLLYFLTWIPNVIGLIILIKAIFSMDFLLFIKIGTYLPLLEIISDSNCCLSPLIYVLVDQRVQNVLTCSKTTVTRPHVTTENLKLSS
ncbi:chemokine-like receptor 1 [Xenopus laevis]|uniref:G-protein coupled receptors family 1 profile domain-containing protein n=2 Tax=Xenopus laevis TaxID=8355 RepID=A0A974BTL1_XENLA|nr:chemokine-like receptor 1 [Xenopus laevis]OCT60547.1 hypothetical protein XELAEV_18046571mg [Xenopus laevis]